MLFNASIGAALEKADSSLGLRFGGNTLETGQYVPRAEATSPPELSFKDAKGPYIVVALDVDAPYPFFTFLAPVLHWIQPGLVPRSGVASETSAPTLTSEGTPFVANWVAPTPPIGSGPHRYCFLLYDQPSDLDGVMYAPPNGETLPNMKRPRYDLDTFEKDAKLGPIIACNYFTCN